MNVLDLALRKVKLRKASGTNGGEWQGPCPGCGGDDRFHVWPEQNDGKGAYWCRGCGKVGDNIQFLRDFCGMSFQEACAELSINMSDLRDHVGTPAPQRTKPVFQPVAHVAPADLWQEKAEKFIAWAQDNISKNDVMQDWLRGRGIGIETVKNYRLGWNPGENDKDIYRARKSWGLPDIPRDDGRPKALWIPRGLVIPYIIDGIIQRIRIRRPEGEPRYYVIPGSSMATMLLERKRRAFVVVESELDAIAVVAGNALAGAVALGSVSAKPDAETFAVLQDALQILNALDYDEAGAKAIAWWSEHFDRCDRWPVPKGKDPGEAVRLGIDLEQWIRVGLPPALTMFKARVVQRPRDATGMRPVTPAILELRNLLRKYPHVIIINTPTRYTVLRNGKYVGGRIGELIFHTPEVRDYLSQHPAEEINGGNLIGGE